jgi:hypothetical protein
MSGSLMIEIGKTPFALMYRILAARGNAAWPGIRHHLHLAGEARSLIVTV